MTPPTSKFLDPFSIVSHEMSNLAKSIANLIGSGHPTLNRVSSYYFEAEGKNVRPLIVLILSKALLKIPLEERNRIPIDTIDVTEQKVLMVHQQNRIVLLLGNLLMIHYLHWQFTWDKSQSDIRSFI